MHRFRLTLLLWLFTPGLQAGHLVGGEIYYRCLGENRYVIGVTMYRDCNTILGFQQFDNTLNVAVYKASNNDLVEVLELNPSSIETNLPLVMTIPCLSDTPDVCIAMLEYSDTFELDVPLGGLYLVNQRCCRTPNALNLVAPSDDFGNTYLAFVPDSTVAECNSSPRFNQVPPKVVCVEAYQNLDYTATDPDGDSLHYVFCDPLHGGGKMNGNGANSPVPAVPTPPPHSSVAWATGFYTGNQIPSSPNASIDSTTGVITLRPDQLGTYVFAVCAQEFRNGIFVSENRRDFQITTTVCDIDAAAAIDSTLDECIGFEIDFYNQSTMGKSFVWDFGDLTTQADTSILFNPSYTYPDTGTYLIRLVSYGDVCTDTAWLEYEVMPKIEPFFDPPVPDCFDRHHYDFFPQGYYTPTTTKYWMIEGDTFLDPTAEPGLRGIKMTEAGEFPVTLLYNDFGCLKSYTDTVVVYPNPDFHLREPPLVLCAPLSGFFSIESTDAHRPRWTWRINQSLLSDTNYASLRLLNPGTYNLYIQLITDSLCIDTVSHAYENQITVLDTPVAGFVVPIDTVNMYEPYFNVFDSSRNANEVEYRVNDVFLSSDRNADFSLPDTGTYAIEQWATHENGCKDMISSLVRVKPEYLVFIPNSFSPDSDGINDLWYPYVYVWEEYELRIFDRWGHLLFFATDPRVGWNGEKLNDGSRCPIGVYFYFIRTVDEDMREWKYDGKITLIR